MDQSLFAAPHGFSQRITSFIACACQGIHQMPLRHLIVLIVNDHRIRPANRTNPRERSLTKDHSWFGTANIGQVCNLNQRPAAVPFCQSGGYTQLAKDQLLETNPDGVRSGNTDQWQKVVMTRTKAMNLLPEPFTDRTVLAANAAPRSRRQTLAGLWRRSFEIRLLLHDGRENRPPGSRGAKRQTCASCLG